MELKVAASSPDHGGHSLMGGIEENACVLELMYGMW